jgi:hypothetical protein
LKIVLDIGAADFQAAPRDKDPLPFPQRSQKVVLGQVLDHMRCNDGLYGLIGIWQASGIGMDIRGGMIGVYTDIARGLMWTCADI